MAKCLIPLQNIIEEPFQDSWKAWILSPPPRNSSITTHKEEKKKKNRRDTFMRSFFKFFYAFFSTSTIHGFYHLTPFDRHWIEHCLWIICIILGICGCAYISSHSWNRYQNDPTVISMERDYMLWNTSLPSLTICPTSKIDEYAVNPEELNLNVDQDNLTDFLYQLADSTYDTFWLMDMDIPEIKAENYMNLTYEYRYKFSHARNPYIDTVDGYPVSSVTEFGICYIYNSKIAFTITVPYFFDDINNMLTKTKSDIKTGSFDADLIGYLTDINSGFRASVTGPGEIPDWGSRWEDYRITTFNTVEYLALSIYSSDSIKSLNIKQRKCRFTDESDLKISKVYSYNLCRMECRMNLAEKLCGCVPHFYRKLDGKRTCSVEDFPCLAEHDDFLITLRNKTTNEKVPCECLPPCDDVNYYADFNKTVPWMLGTIFKWGMVKFPKYRLRREIIFSFADLLVSIGGTAGLFLGCSVLSFIEIVYFLTLRLIIYICRRR